VTARPRPLPLLAAAARALGLLAAGAGLAFVVLHTVPSPSDASARFAWHATVLASALFVSNGLLAHRVGGLSWEELGWRPPGGRATWFALGAATGALLAAVALGIALPGSGATLRARVGPTATLAPLVVALVAAALFEELVFRGAPLVLLAQAVGRWPATLLGAVGFGIAHLRNPSATLLGTANIALAAVLLSIAFWSKGGMPLAWGVHFGWNAGLGLVFGAPVSGIALGAARLSYATGVRPWVDGGAFGPEGGVAATLAFMVGVAAFVGPRLARPKAWLT